jgi:hypothetical protein
MCTPSVVSGQVSCWQHKIYAASASAVVAAISSGRNADTETLMLLPGVMVDVRRHEITSHNITVVLCGLPTWK